MDCNLLNQYDGCNFTIGKINRIMNSISQFFLSLAVFLYAGSVVAEATPVYGPYNPPPHHSYMIPSSVKGVTAHSVSLDGEWEVKTGNMSRWHK